MQTTIHALTCIIRLQSNQRLAFTHSLAHSLNDVYSPCSSNVFNVLARKLRTAIKTRSHTIMDAYHAPQDAVRETTTPLLRF